MKLEALVNQHFDELNENDKIVIKQILIFQHEYQYLTSDKIAKQCHISRTTLLRLCHKIGLQSFSDLKYLLKETNPFTTMHTNSYHAICEDYYTLLNELKKVSFLPVCKRISKANTIYVYGSGNEQKNLAQELKRMFLSVGKCVIDLFDYGEIEFMKQSFDKEDLFIIVSLSGETKEGIDILHSISGYIQTLSITRLQNNTISTLCNQNLYVATQTLDVLQDSSYELVGVFYALLDVLFINYIEYQRRVT